MNNGSNTLVDPRIVLPGSGLDITTVGLDTSVPSVVVIADDNPGEWRYFPIVIGLIVVFLGTVGNGITLGAYQRNKSLQTSFNVLIANLCCVELFFAGVIIPLQLPGYFIQASPYPNAFCKVIGYFYYTSMASSLQNLVAIAVNRYIGIVETKKYQILFTGKRLAICIASIWILPPLLYLPVVIGGGISWQSNSLRCSIGKTENKAIQWYNTVLNIIFQTVGLILLIVLYSSIMSTVKVVQKKLERHSTTNLSKRSKDSKGTKKHESGNKSAPTSGDETFDNFRPSSMISGGLMFRPAHPDPVVLKVNNQEMITYDMETNMPISPVPDSMISSHSHGSMNHLDMYSRNSAYTSTKTKPVEVPEVAINGKRTSVWRILFPKKQSTDVTKENSLQIQTSLMKSSQDILSQDLPTSNGNTNERCSVVLNENGVYETAIKLRNPTKEKLDMRRKKSLSAPTMPALDTLTPRKASFQPSIRDHPAEEDGTHSDTPMETDKAQSEDDILRLKRHGTMHSSRYEKKKNKSNFTRASTEKSPNKIYELRLSSHNAEMKKQLTASTPALNREYSEDVPRSRMNTITRKIWDKKSKKFRASEKRNKRKAMKKKHAREKQLVNSSLVICIAFAVCILPTALLHLFETLVGVKVEASIKLCVNSIAWLHAVINPFVYGYMNQFYRKEYAKIYTEMKSIFINIFKCTSSSKSVF